MRDVSGGIVLASLLALIVATGSCTGADEQENQWGPFEGRVLDAQSGDGIAGAAVIVFWQRAIPNPIEGHDEFYDAHWTVTEADGNFRLPRRDPPFLKWGISGASLTCVAPGYLPYEFEPSDNLKKENARLRMGTLTVRLKVPPPMDRLEKLRTYAHFSSIPNEKFQTFSLAVNQRRKQIGLRPFNLISGHLEEPQ